MIFFKKQREKENEDLIVKLTQLISEKVEKVVNREFQKVIGSENGKYVENCFDSYLSMDSRLSKTIYKIFEKELGTRILQNTKKYIEGEKFIDSLTERINRKQLK